MTGKFTRDEIEQAFETFQARAKAAGQSNDWREWSECFTEDAQYYEHHYGRMNGREEIYKWIQSTMTEPLFAEMSSFPIDWYMIDEERGWVIAQVWNRMIDPGDGSLHQAYNFTLLKYAGNMKWSYEEDIYNPAHFRDMIRGWVEKKKALSEKASG